MFNLLEKVIVREGRHGKIRAGPKRFRAVLD
jgi:hypothetical protein